MAEQTEKKRPGRPPLRKTVSKAVRKGIVTQPIESGNILEMVYDAPGAFKNIFTHFKHIGCTEIHLKCTPEYMIFFTRDHLNKQRVLVKIEGKLINSYYCAKNLMLYMTFEYYNKIFSTINKSYNTISIVHKEGEPDYLYIILDDTELKIQNSYKIQTSTFLPDPVLYEAESYLTKESLDSYTIYFRLPHDKFKRLISDVISVAGKDAPNVQMIKLHDQPLFFKFQTEKVCSVQSYLSDKDIKLRNKLNPGETFMTDIKISNLKTLSGALLENDINLYAKQREDLILTSSADDLTLTDTTEAIPIVITTLLSSD